MKATAGVCCVLLMIGNWPCMAAPMATQRLRPMPGTAPNVVRFDLSALPGSARILRADLRIVPLKPLTGKDEDARINIEITADCGGGPAASPLVLRGPWFDRLDATGAVVAWVSGKPNGGFVVNSCRPWDPKAACLDVAFEDKPSDVPPAARGLRAFHRRGQTFLVFEEIDACSAEMTPTWGELKRRLAQLDQERTVRYGVYRHHAPITAESLAEAQWLADVEPMSGYNVLGRSVDQLIALHRRRAIEDMDFAKHLARNDYFAKYHPDMAEMDELPIQRLAIEDGRPLPPKTGLHVHQPERAGKAFYAIVSMVDGVANTRDVSCAGPVEEMVGRGEPVLQGAPAVTVFFDYPGQRRHYVQWAAPPLAHLPSRYYNWGVFVPRGYDQAQVKRLSIFFHDATQRYLKPPWPHRQDTVLLSPHDAPYRSYGYGHHESLGTLRSFRQGIVQPLMARRVDSMLDWALREFSADSSCVSCGGAGPWGGTAALQYGLRRPGKIAYVMAEDSPDPDPQQTPLEYSYYGRSDVRKTDRPAMEAVWGKPDWGVQTEDGRPIWAELNLAACVRTHGAKTTLPFLSLGSGSQHLTWKQQAELMRAYCQTHNGLMAEFFWGSSHHLPLPSAEEGGQWFEPRADQPILAFHEKDRSPNPDFFQKHFETGHRGYSSGSRLNTKPRWDSRDILDEPDRLEITVYAARKVVYAGRVAAGVTIRNTRQFCPKTGEKLVWSLPNPQQPKKPQGGDATVDEHGHIVIADIQFNEPARLVIRRSPAMEGRNHD